jgi:hypothetical protein
MNRRTTWRPSRDPLWTRLLRRNLVGPVSGRRGVPLVLLRTPPVILHARPGGRTAPGASPHLAMHVNVAWAEWPAPRQPQLGAGTIETDSRRVVAAGAHSATSREYVASRTAATALPDMAHRALSTPMRQGVPSSSNARPPAVSLAPTPPRQASAIGASASHAHRAGRRPVRSLAGLTPFSTRVFASRSFGKVRPPADSDGSSARDVPNLNARSTDRWTKSLLAHVARSVSGHEATTEMPPDFRPTRRTLVTGPVTASREGERATQPPAAPAPGDRQQSTPPAIDVARLSEDVYRHIQRKVRIERERRGS